MNFSNTLRFERNLMTENLAEAEETFVADHRDTLPPAQHVERKLVKILRTAPLLVSHMQKDCRPVGR